MSDAAIWGDSTNQPIDYVIEMKRAMLASAEKKVLLLDASKLARRAWQRAIPRATFDTIIVDDGISKADLENFRALGPEVIVAS